MTNAIKKMTPCELTEFMTIFKLKTGSSLCVINYCNGDLYKGETDSNGKKCGLGELYFINGDIFAARWVDDVANGCGIYMCVNGDEYKGNWRNGIFNGKQNKILYANGDVYVGGTTSGNLNGIGKMCYADGEIYDGSFLLGYRCGYGISKWGNGDSYKGHWDADAFNGNGMLDASNTIGHIYTGPWLNGCQQPDGEILASV